MPLACGLLLVSTAATVPARAQDAAIVPTGAQNAQEPPAAPGEVEPVEQAPAVDVQALQAWRELKTPDEIERAYEKLKGSVQELEVSHTEAAIARYRAFYQAAADRWAPSGLQLTARVAQLYGSVLDDREAALAILDWGVGHYVKQAGVSRLVQQREQLLRPQLELPVAVGAPTLKGKAVPAPIAPVASIAPSKARVAGEIAPVLEGRNASVPGVVKALPPGAVVPRAIEPVSNARLGEASALVASPSIASVTAIPPAATTRPGAAPVVLIPLSPFSRVPDGAVAKVDGITAAPLPFPVPKVKAVTSGHTEAKVPTMAVDPLGAPKGSSSLLGGAERVLPERVGTAKTASRWPQTAPSAVSSGAGRLALVVEQMRAGKLTPQEAWQARWLSLEDVVLALSQPELGLDNWYGYARELAPADYALRQELAQLLVEHGGELMAQPHSHFNGQALPWRVQVSVGHLWRDRKDERAVAWYEAALSQVLAQGAFPSDGKDEFALRVFYALEPLAHYYRETGQDKKAAQSFGRVEQLAQEKRIPAGWWVPDALIEAARDWVKAGDGATARQLYSQVEGYGQGWYSVLARYDQARPLMDEGKSEEAKAILSKPLKMTVDAMKGQIAQQSWLASLAYQQGNLDEALRHGQAVLDAGKGIEMPSGSVKNLYEMGRDVYNRAGGWKTQPIQTDVKEIVIKTNPLQPDKPTYARFRIKTYGDTSVTATVDNPNVQVRVLPVNNWQRAGLNAQEEEMEVIVQSNSLNPFKDVPLVLSSATRGKTTTVRLSLSDKPTRSALTTGG